MKEKIKQQEEVIKIMERYFELIIDYGFDYDGFNNVKDLKRLIDGLVKYASLGRAANKTEVISIGRNNKKYNILGEEL